MFQEHFKRVLKGEFLPNIIGLEKEKELIKSALLMERHILLIGPPGTGKTTIAKSIARLLPEIEVKACGFNCLPGQEICHLCKSGKVKETKISKGEERFVRVQGSSDLTPEDLLGDIDPVMAIKYGPFSIEAFKPGKIFKANNGILFFDEINRAPEKVQNALLQVLAEGKATIGSYEIDFPANFILIGTMNPEDTSTEPLSDVFLDRFDVIYIDYPKTLEDEVKIVLLNTKKIEVKFPSELLNFVIDFIRSLRSEEFEKKPSVRASIGIYERATATAFLKGKKEVELDDIEENLLSVLIHRIRLKPSLRYTTDLHEYLSRKWRDYLRQKGDFL